MLEFAMFPTDKGESVSEYVSRIIKMIDSLQVKYQLTPMGTIIEVDRMDQALHIVNESYKTLEPDCNRIYSTIKLDIRRGRKSRLKQKIASIEKRLGKKLS